VQAAVMMKNDPMMEIDEECVAVGLFTRFGSSHLLTDQRHAEARKEKGGPRNARDLL
jgi:hypothetical protein